MPRCICGLLLFNSADEAAADGVPFQGHINLNMNGRCPGCAGLDHVDYPTQMHIEAMANGQGQKEGIVPGSKVTDEEVRNVYHNNYIGLSESANTCASRLGYTTGVSFSDRCKKLGLRMRGRTEAKQARDQAGQLWVWPDEERSAMVHPVAVVERNGRVAHAENGRNGLNDLARLVEYLRSLSLTGGQVQAQARVHLNLTIDLDWTSEE